jgi:CRP/FNR family transcriptional regulator, anaerobic regulatory protein
VPNDSVQDDSWVARFAGLERLDDEVRATLVARSRVADIPKGTVVFGPGKAPEHLVLLMEGTIRVQQVSETGREIVLYRVNAGESCVLTTACLLAYEDYAAEGIAETDVRAVLIPRGVFDDLISRSARFRQFVFSAYSRRISDLFQVVEQVAFQRMDIRLAERLVALSGGSDTLKATHQQLAAELGTAREVISRLLQEFQRRGWIELARGTITLKDRAALEGLGEAA